MTRAEQQLTAPLHEGASERIAAAGLRWELVTGADRDNWLQAVARGFLDTERDEKQREVARKLTMYRRMVGVFDDSSPMPLLPVATFATWDSQLTVPGGRTIASCAVSGVTVSPTHRRRGLARTMMEGELRTAASLGYATAMLTASEAVLYGRYGFGSAANVTSWKIRTRQAGWVGPVPEGRIDFISREQWRELGPQLHERTRVTSPGEVVIPPSHWDTFAGTREDAKDPGAIRVVQYRDADGVTQGALAYRVSVNEVDYADSSVEVTMLLAATTDAYAALWRWVLSLDLIGTVTASERSTDEPLLYMLADPRAAQVTLIDHQYVRILDVAAALSARTYEAAGSIVLDVDDQLDIDSGTFLLTVDDAGSAVVQRVTDVPEGVPTARLTTTELSALYLGGVRARTLHSAGRITTDAVDLMDDMFRSRDTARLSFWY